MTDFDEGGVGVTETEVVDSGNGSKWTKGLFAGVGVTAGLAAGALSMGLWAGGLSADVRTVDIKLSGHMANPLIHQTPAEKEAMVRSVIDREINPTLVRIERRLDRIERILDEGRRR